MGQGVCIVNELMGSIFSFLLTISKLRDDKALVFNIANSDKVSFSASTLSPGIRPRFLSPVKVEAVAIVRNPRT